MQKRLLFGSHSVICSVYSMQLCMNRQLTGDISTVTCSLFVFQRCTDFIRIFSEEITKMSLFAKNLTSPKTLYCVDYVGVVNSFWSKFCKLHFCTGRVLNASWTVRRRLLSNMNTATLTLTERSWKRTFYKIYKKFTADEYSTSHFSQPITNSQYRPARRWIFNLTLA